MNPEPVVSSHGQDFSDDIRQQGSKRSWIWVCESGIEIEMDCATELEQPGDMTVLGKEKGWQRDEQ